MNTIEVMVVRIYITESSDLLHKITAYLQNEVKVRGISVFRAISGFGDTKHTSALVDLSLDLPLALEFFDADKMKIENALAHLSTFLKPEHIIFWEAKANE